MNTTNKFQKGVFWWLKIMKHTEVIKPLLVQQTIFKVAWIWIKHNLYQIKIRLYRMIMLVRLNNKVWKVFLFLKERVSMIVWIFRMIRVRLKENLVEGLNKINSNQLKFWTNNFQIINTKEVSLTKIIPLLMHLVIRANKMEIHLLPRNRIQDKTWIIPKWFWKKSHYKSKTL